MHIVDLHDPTEEIEAKRQKSQEAVSRVAAMRVTAEDWKRLFSLKNTVADEERLSEVKAAMEAGKLHRNPADAINKQGRVKKFSKAEALRLWRSLQEQERMDALRRMVAEMPKNYRLITSKATLNEFLALLNDEEEIVFDVETTGTDIWSDYIVGHVISAVKADVHAYIPTKHRTDRPQLPHEYVMRALKPYYEDPALGKIAHNAKFDIHMLRNEGVHLRGLTWDTQVAMHVLNENEPSRALKELVTKYLKIESYTYGFLFGDRGFHEVSDLTTALAYAGKDGDITLRLRDFQREHLKRIGLLRYYETVENPLIPVVVDMEREGFLLDPEKATEIGGQLADEIAKLNVEMRRDFKVDADFNFNSPEQLASLLYDKLKLDRGKPWIQRSTKKTVLEAIQNDHPGVTKLLEYREKAKLHGAFFDKLPRQVHSDGRVRGEFNQDATKTGRFSSKSPNLQQLPKYARTMFKAPDNHVILSGDFSQQEPRILAHFSGEPGLIEIFKSDRDAYRGTAARFYGIPYDEVPNDLRDKMKVGFLATAYGTQARTAAEQLGTTEAEAQKFLDEFFALYPHVTRWIERTKRFLRRHKYVEMLEGRKRRFPNYYSGAWWQRQGDERQAVNACIQGSAAIQTKVTMIAVNELCVRKGWRMLAAIHDEILVVAPETITPEDVAEFRGIMENAYKLRVPNKCDVEIGRSWGSLVDADEWFKHF